MLLRVHGWFLLALELLESLLPELLSVRFLIALAASASALIVSSRCRLRHTLWPSIVRSELRSLLAIPRLITEVWLRSAVACRSCLSLRSYLLLTLIFHGRWQALPCSNRVLSLLDVTVNPFDLVCELLPFFLVGAIRGFFNLFDHQVDLLFPSQFLIFEPIELAEGWSDDFSDFPMLKMAKKRFWIGDRKLKNTIDKKDPNGKFILG